MFESEITEKRAYTFFDMWGPYRESVIEQHRFYVEQGKKKFLSQFNNMEEEANEAAACWLEKRSESFDPDRDDPGSIEEDAYHEGIEYFRLLSEQLDQTRLSIVAGMYHAWDKELRRWLLKEIHHWHRGSNVTEKVWKATFEEIVELLDSTGLVKRSSSFINKLSACRYVVNVYKHGEGLSLNKLKQNHSEYLRTQTINGDTPDMNWIDYTHLSVTDEQLDEFSASITEFWRSIPAKIREAAITLPSWFEGAMQKDYKVK